LEVGVVFNPGDFVRCFRNNTTIKPPGPLPPPMANICPFRRHARIPRIMGNDLFIRFVVI